MNLTRIETPPIIPPDPWGALPKRIQDKILEDHRYFEIQGDWWDDLYGEFASAAETLCISIAGRGKNGKAINFQSYPWGCSFDGLYGPMRYNATNQEEFSVARLLIRAEYPGDTELHRIADGLYEVQANNDWAIVAQVKSIGHDTHSRNTSIDVQLDDVPDDHELSDSDEEEVAQLLRDFMDWMSERLEAAHDDLTSDENIIYLVREGIIDITEYQEEDEDE
jgi:hypothetical protein